MRLDYELRQGKGGRWRAFILDRKDKDRLIASVGMARGYTDKEQAEREAKVILDKDDTSGRIAALLVGMTIGFVLGFAVLNFSI